MKKLYYEIIDDCIEKFPVGDRQAFNFALLDFMDGVFHNYGRKPRLTSQEITLLLAHAQQFVEAFGRESRSVKKLTAFLADGIRILPPPKENIRTIYEIIFEGKPATEIESITSDHIARFISLLPLKHYWDNSGAVYEKVCRDERNISNIYLYQYRYDERHRKPSEVLCREIEIPEGETHPKILEIKLEELQQKDLSINAEYFGLKPGDWELYELYGQLFDLLNWGASNPGGIIDYIDSRTREFTFYNCVFPVVFHGIYYGIAYFDLPSDYFVQTHSTAKKLSSILDRCWTYVNHYFPAIIIDAYNSRMITRFTRDNSDLAEDVVKVIRSKVPFRFCYHSQTGALYSVRLETGEFDGHFQKTTIAANLDITSPIFRNVITAIDSNEDFDQLFSISQQVFDHDLIFLFSRNAFPGRETCKPILESHLAQAAFVLETLKDQHEREVNKERNRVLDMFAHDAKTTRELLIADLEEGLSPDLAALQLQEQSHKEKVMRNYLLSRPSLFAEGPRVQPQIEMTLQQLFVRLFRKTWRVWLKSRRFRESFRRNRHPSLPFSPDSERHEVESFLDGYFDRYENQPRLACLEILKATFKDLSPQAEIQISASPLLLSEPAIVRIEMILYNLLCNYFKHAAPSPLTGCNECVMTLQATDSSKGVYFYFLFRNSALIRERFSHDLQALTRPGHEIHGLQTIRYLIEVGAGETRPLLAISQDDYIWQIEIGRECHACRQKAMVDSRSRR